jgi:hypothetical protein
MVEGINKKFQERDVERDLALMSSSRDGRLTIDASWGVTPICLSLISHWTRRGRYVLLAYLISDQSAAELCWRTK